MTDSQDALQLKAWCSDRCERSFRGIVQRHLGMVYALALRRLGNGTQAGEVAQNVFIVLARKAGRLRHEAPLSPWLHRCTMIECADQIRRESRRMDAMKRYHAEMLDNGAPEADAWREIVPHLDEAVDTLGGSDRQVIIMHFYQQLTYGEIGAALGKTAKAAQKQGERALERICRFMRRKGITSRAAVLATGFAASVRAATDPGLASLSVQITGKAVSAASGPLTLTQTLLSTLMNTTTRTALITTAVLTVPLVLQWRQSSTLSTEVADLRRQVQAAGPVARSVRGGPAGRQAAPATASAASGKGMTASEAGAAWEKALMENDPVERQRLISELLSNLTAESAPGVLETFKRLEAKGMSFGVEKLLFVRVWGRLDGAAAMAALQGDDTANTALAGWAGKNPDAAKAYVESLTDPQRKAEMTYGLLEGWAAVDFDAAAAYAAAAPKSTERDRFRELLLAVAFANGGEEGARKFFESIPANEHNQLYRQRAFEDVTRLLMKRDPAQAREWLAREDHQAMVNPNVLAMAGAGDPQSALTWMDSLKNVDPKTATQAAANVLANWVQNDPAAATAWMNAQNERADRDALVSAMAKTVGYKETEGAVKWAQTINDPEQRQQTLDSVIRKSLRRDPQGAPAELAALGITQADIEQAQSRGGGAVTARTITTGGESTFFYQALDSSSSILSGGASGGDVVLNASSGGVAVLPPGVSTGAGGVMTLKTVETALGPAATEFRVLRGADGDVE